MKPLLLQKNTKNNQQSFAFRYAKVPYLYNKWHYHKEFELLFVVKSSGTRFVGNSGLPFFEDDLVLVGSNVPHYWQNDEKYFQGDPNLYAEAFLIQFTEETFKGILDLPEMAHIKNLLKKASYGLQFVGDTKEHISILLWDMANYLEENRLIQLMKILDILAKSNEFHTLSEIAYIQKESQNSDSLEKVCNYILENWNQPISLEEISNIANMTEKSFCRFFKKSTKRTLTEFINEIRVSKACKLLISENYSVGQICNQTGFSSVSYFNRIFKSMTNHTPKEYRSKMTKNHVVEIE